MLDEVDQEHRCGGDSFRRRGSTSLGCLHHRAGPLALLSPPSPPPPPRRLALPKTQHRRVGTVLSVIIGRMKNRGAERENGNPLKYCGGIYECKFLQLHWWAPSSQGEPLLFLGFAPAAPHPQSFPTRISPLCAEIWGGFLLGLGALCLFCAQHKAS